MVEIIEENRPSFSRSIASSLGAGISQGIGQGLQHSMKLSELEAPTRLKEHQMRRLTESLIQRGINPEDAALYSLLTEGGKTQFAKELFEQKKREGKTEKRFPKMELEEEWEPGEEKEEIKFEDEGLTPKEKVARETERYKTNLPIYQEAGTKLKGMARDKERLDILESLNKTKKLPKNLGRVNVDKEGNLRFPFASSPESQRYAKTLNEFSSGAKDTFGSRVTNFDLSQYLKRFPTLLNSEEGRKQLIEQMKIVNEINSIHYKNLKDIYDQAGGVRKIDADRAEALAEKRSQKRIDKLVNKFKEIGQFTSLPSAQEYEGRKVRNLETGEILISNGQDWIPFEG